MRLWGAFALMVLIFICNCLSIEEKLFYSQTFPQKTEASRIEVILGRPEAPVLKLGELSIVYNEGYKKDNIMRLLKKRASELGADMLKVKKEKRIADNWVVRADNSERGHTTGNRKIKLTVTMLRYQD